MSSTTSELALPDGRSVPLMVRRSPTARRMRLAVDPCHGAVTLSLPRRAALDAALFWARGQAVWIEAALSRIPERQALVPGGILPWEGRGRLIDWYANARRTPELYDDRIALGGPHDAVASRLIAWARREARLALEAETRALADEAGLSVRKVAIGDARTRWGSCNSAGDIRYNWRLMMAPPFVRRATIAHELAHRIHMNHSPAFHALARELTGFDPKGSRDWLKANGAALHRVG